MTTLMMLSAMLIIYSVGSSAFVAIDQINLLAIVKLNFDGLVLVKSSLSLSDMVSFIIILLTLF